MYGCYSSLKCYNLFSGVNLSIRSFCFIIMMQNLSAPFIFQEDCRIETEHVLFHQGFFSKLRVRVLEGEFYCVQTSDRVDGPL